MREITFDIETANLIPVMNRQELHRLDLAVVAIHDSATGEFSSYDKSELPKLWPILEQADILIGYNSDNFDIPLLNYYYPGDLTKIKSVDLLAELYKTLGRRLRLQNLAEATLGVGKSANGIQSVEWWQAGEYQKVRDYCIQDVKVTRDLFDYALEHGKWKYKDIRETREMKLDTSNWQTPPEASAFTHTLGL